MLFKEPEGLTAHLYADRQNVDFHACTRVVHSESAMRTGIELAFGGCL